MVAQRVGLHRAPETVLQVAEVGGVGEAHRGGDGVAHGLEFARPLPGLVHAV